MPMKKRMKIRKVQTYVDEEDVSLHKKKICEQCIFFDIEKCGCGGNCFVVQVKVIING